MADGGIHVKVAQERLGHSSTAMSLHYTHTTPAQHEQAALAVEQALQSA